MISNLNKNETLLEDIPDAQCKPPPEVLMIIELLFFFFRVELCCYLLYGVSYSGATVKIKGSYIVQKQSSTLHLQELGR